MHWERLQNPQFSQLCMWEQYHLVERGFFFFSCHSCWSTSILKPTAAWAAMHDPMIHAFGEWLNLCWLWQKQAGEEKLTRELAGVCSSPQQHQHFYYFEHKIKTTAMIALCLMLQSLNNFISRPLCLVRELSSCCRESKSLRRWFMTTLGCETT